MTPRDPQASGSLKCTQFIFKSGRHLPSSNLVKKPREGLERERVGLEREGGARERAGLERTG